ncbi:histidinol-phosphatase HisJ family protein [Desulfitobacterium sp.]|uniref:histidinol-phosphatase HisJ family protein n=1 Tax=Desulfitobacterium sp. TaxID=49981 RepID=UPI002B54A84C|nr:histidinol-phosphatase HisJ family protein [Desulfitobacterium sp.]HVJ48169.1 histidinol-phosphatase HisJ family protein [Desulfitobacterium sp.]
MLDLHTHLIGHQDRPANRENIQDYLEAARRAGLQEIGFSDHDMYLEDLNLPLIREVAEEYPDLKVRVGLEVDYRAEDEAKIQTLLQTFPFDYVIGSVHEIKNWLFDYPDQAPKHREVDPDQLYLEYFSLVEKAARSQLFTTIGHFDLIKIFGVRPRTDVRELAANALQAIVENGLVAELNTAGRYKPVGEFYPERKLIQEMVNRGIEFTLGSDAHEAQYVGRDLSEATHLLQACGVKRLIRFEQKKRLTLPLS